MIYILMVCSVCHAWQIIVMRDGSTVIYSGCPRCHQTMVPVQPQDGLQVMSDKAQLESTTTKSVPVAPQSLRELAGQS